MTISLANSELVTVDSPIQGFHEMAAGVLRIVRANTNLPILDIVKIIMQLISILSIVQNDYVNQTVIPPKSYVKI